MVSLQAQSTSLYLYYYSSSDNAYIVERADGSDRRMLGSELSPSLPSAVYGPGWSPNGEWLSWRFTFFGDHPTALRAGVINVSGEQVLQSLEVLESIWLLEWSPEGDFVFTISEFTPCPLQSCRTYQLTDANSDTIVASVDLVVDLAGTFPSVEWLEDGGIVFYEREEAEANLQNRYVKVEMFPNGQVVQTEVDRSTFRENLRPDPTSIFITEESRFVSPSGRYTIFPYTSQLLDAEAQQPTLATPNYRSMENLSIQNVRWSADERWVLLNSLPSGGGYVTVTYVYNLLTGELRELTQCGNDASCAGWLPENVDVSRIPLAADAN
jgi:hypothetical protein